MKHECVMIDDLDGYQRAPTPPLFSLPAQCLKSSFFKMTISLSRGLPTSKLSKCRRRFLALRAGTYHVLGLWQWIWPVAEPRAAIYQVA